MVEAHNVRSCKANPTHGDANNADFHTVGHGQPNSARRYVAGGDIGDKVRDAGIRKTALILVGNFLGSEYHYSKLYAADFSHEYRKA